MFGRKRRSSRRLSLSPLNRLMPLARYRDVRTLDSWEPADYPTAPHPERAHVLNAVSQRVEGLAASGAVDAELGHVVDAEIAAWLEQWTAQLAYDAIGRARVLATLRAASLEEVTRRRHEDDVAHGQLAEATDEYFVARAVYFGDATPDAS